MHIQSVIVLFLAISCVCISAQRIDCEKIHRSCVACIRRVRPRDDINAGCRRMVGNRWIWKNQNQCDIQKLYCQNPKTKLTCNMIAILAGMRPRR